MLSFSSFAAEFTSNRCLYQKTFPHQNHSISHLSHVEQFSISILNLIRNFTLLFTPHATWKHTSLLALGYLVLPLLNKGIIVIIIIIIKKYGRQNYLTSSYLSTNLF